MDGRRQIGSRKSPRPVPALFLLLGLCAVPMVLGAEAVLLFELPLGVPLGTLLAALMFVLGATISVVSSPSQSSLRLVSVITLLLALVWLPFGTFLAGNPSLSFVNDARDSAVFWRFTAGLAILIAVMMVCAGITNWLARRRRMKDPVRP